MTKSFLQADWRKLLLVNYSVPQRLLEPFLPNKTEIDLFNDICYISLVGFMFMNTRIRGIKIPFHANFEEVNLRFYVRHQDNNVVKRGVVFIKEIVPKPALAMVANAVYKENYEAFPMKHSWLPQEDILNIEYKWRKGTWNSINVSTDKEPQNIVSGSEQEFITEHFWGYTKITDIRTSEYEVEHPRWKVYHTQKYQIDVKFSDTYGSDFGFLQTQTPLSVFLAEGSEVIVRKGKEI